jgi:hypothetical protein
MKSIAVVTTTIHVPTFLKAYIDNARFFGHHVTFYVVGDKKTADGAAEFCNGFPNCIYLSPETQEHYLKRFPELARELKWNDQTRRNVGHLWAYEFGADTIIMLDDDNYCSGEDFVAEHDLGGTSVPLIETSSGWFNVCESLREEHDVKFYPRGYKPSERWRENTVNISKSEAVHSVVNAGLWLDNPDVDAITRLERPLNVIGRALEFPRKFGLYPGTWSPWNCQNTAISREILPAYFLSSAVGRHCDIWASYIVNRIVQETSDDVITFGSPLAHHVRSQHNLYRDLEAEIGWIEQTNDFCDTLHETHLATGSYRAKFAQLTQALSPRWRELANGMTAWAETFDRLRSKK